MNFAVIRVNTFAAAKFYQAANTFFRFVIMSLRLLVSGLKLTEMWTLVCAVYSGLRDFFLKNICVREDISLQNEYQLHGPTFYWHFCK